MLFGDVIEQDAVKVLAGNEPQGVAISILIDALETADFAALSVDNGEATEGLGGGFDLGQ